MSITKNVLLKSSMKNKKGKIRMIFDIESQILALFDSSPLIQNSKFNNFFCIPRLKTPQPVLPYSALCWSVLEPEN